MGQLVTTIAGGALGFMIGGPMGASIGMTLGGMIGQTLFGPTIKGPRLNDLKVTASTYGSAIPEIYGTVRLGGNMIWTSGIKETKKTSRAGKGGPKQTTYSYDASFAMALCKGPIDDILRIWADGKLIYDKTGGSTRSPSAPEDAGQIFPLAVSAVVNSGKKKKNINIRIYRGNEEQLPDSLIAADKGAENTSAHRGIAYAVFERMPLGDFGNRIPQLSFEVTRALSDALPSLPAKIDEATLVANNSNSDWYPDWELGYLVGGLVDTPNKMVLVKLDDMRQVFTKESNLVNFNRPRLMQGTGGFLATTGSRNSNTLRRFEIFSFSETAAYGEISNSVTGTVNVDTETYFLGNLGQSGYCRNGRGIHYFVTTWARSTWVIDPSDSKYPVAYHRADFEPWFLYEGQRNTGISDVLGYRGANGRLEVFNYRIAAGSTYTIEQTPTGPEWRSAPISYAKWDIVPFAGETLSVRTAIYDPTDDCMFCLGVSNGVTCVFKWHRATQTFKFRVKHPNIAPTRVNSSGNRMHYSRLSGGIFAWMSPGSNVLPAQILVIDLQTGEALPPVAYGNTFGSAAQSGLEQHWDDVSQSMVVRTATGYRRIWIRNGVANITIPAVVRDICLRTNVLTEDEIDTSGLSPDPLTGYIIDRPTTARDVLRQLATGFLFDGYESDYTLKFKSRGAESVVTIPEEWIGRNGEGNVVSETLTQELEMPMRIVVNYYDITRDHQQGTQTAKRLAGPIPSMLTSKEEVIELPITWTPTQAKQLADKMLKMTWANRTSYQMTLPWRYLRYDPTDVLTVQLDSGTTYKIRVGEMTMGADFSLEVQGVSEKEAAYVSDAVGAVSDIPVPSIGVDYPAFPFVINTPLLRDIDYDASEFARCYLSAGSNAVAFSGATVVMQEGLDYRAIGSVDSEIVFGFAASALPAVTGWAGTDESSQLFIRLAETGMTLESVTQEEMLESDVNAALVGEEIIQFRDAELQADGSWKLTGLLRGVRGTSYAIRSHAAGERFLLLDPARIVAFTRAPSEYNVTKEFRAVIAGTAIEEADAVTATLTPRDLQPWAPEDVKVADDATTVTVTAQRRSRIIATLQNGTGTIHYKEGDKPSARVDFSAWPGLSLSGVAPATAAPITGQAALFDANGNDLPLEFSFPLAELGSETRVLIRLVELGAVEGIPKWVAAERIGPNLWNLTELY